MLPCCTMHAFFVHVGTYMLFASYSSSCWPCFSMLVSWALDPGLFVFCMALHDYNFVHDQTGGVSVVCGSSVYGDMHFLSLFHGMVYGVCIVGEDGCRCMEGLVGSCCPRM